MRNSPYRDLENPPEEKILDRFREIFTGEKKSYDSKYVASNSHGFGYVEAHKENDAESEGETEIYQLTIGPTDKPVTIKVVASVRGIFLNGYKGNKSGNNLLNRAEILEIMDEIQLANELKPGISEPINGDSNKRSKTIAKIQEKGIGSGYTWVSNVTADGLLSLERKTTRTHGLLIIELEIPAEKKRLRFSINGKGEVVEIVKEKTEGMDRKTLEIERIRGGFSNRKELKKDSKEFGEAARTLDKNLESFKLPFSDETEKSDDTDKIRTAIRKKIDEV